MKQVSLQKNYMKYVVHLNLGDLLRLFKMGNTSLKGFEDDKKIELDFKLWNINKSYIDKIQDQMYNYDIQQSLHNRRCKSRGRLYATKSKIYFKRNY